MSAVALDVAAARARFSALERDLAFFDGPGGTQVPDEVIDAIASYLRDDNANVGGPYETSRRTEALITEARLAAGGFLGCSPDETVFGANMTTLNFALTRACARELSAGDEIVVTRLDHDANVSPWLELAHDAGALSWVDAVHFAPHGAIDVAAAGADVLICSPYKFFGPHMGLAFGRAELLERWRPYKVRPAPNEPAGHRFETGTMAHELLAGFVAAVDYIDSLGWEPIVAWERELGERFLEGLPSSCRLYGPPTMEGRVPTFCFNVEGLHPRDAAVRLGERGIAVWHGNYYALEVMARLGLEDGAVRAGIVHYNTAEEVDRLLEALAGL